MSDNRTPGDGTVGGCADNSRQPSATEVRAGLERILASRCFQQAVRASHFLKFVVEETLTGGGQRLKGYTIGVEVFGRPADFDAQSDALVRVEAGRLRRRLVEYYAREGAGDALRIELPRGSYAVEYRFVPTAGSVVAAPPAPVQPAAAVRALGVFPWRRVAAALALLLAAAGGVIASQQRALYEANRAVDVLGEPQRTELPRIVVVPFGNLSADGALDVIAASMTEEIMVRLDDLDLFVAASAATWYGPSEVKGFGATAGGGYLLTGSVRGSVAEARITVRLMEAGSGAQLWTAAYDESLTMEQLPGLLEQVSRDVVALAAPYGPIFEAELARARRSVQAPKLRDCLATYYDYRRRKSSTAQQDALACFQSVSGREPDVAQVWSGLAMLYVDDYAAGFGRGGDATLEAARAATTKALILDRDDFLGNLALTRVQFFDGNPAFRQTIDRTLALRPDSVQAFAQGGFLLAVRGDAARGLLLIQQARALSKTPLELGNLAYAVTYLREHRFAEALAFASKIDARNWVVAQAVVAAAAAHGGHVDTAHAAAQRLRELYPQFEAEAIGNFERWHFDEAFYDVLVSGLEAARLDLRGEAAVLSGS